jgi:uncharacterized protein with NRDE domain
MCLVVAALDVHPNYPLVVAANRDEFHARAALAAHWGTAPPFAGILAGRDIEAGGTWLGVRKDGGWALLTNVRDAHQRFDPAAPSRGSLVPALLNGADNPTAALANVMRNAHTYNGFNLLAGDAGAAQWASNRSTETRGLTAGVHGLSNALLDTPWPKLVQTRAAVAAWARHDDANLEPVFLALADRSTVSDTALPATGVPLHWERLLSAPFIVSDAYGTRCSTVFVIDRRGIARFVERSFDAKGNASGEVDIAFDLVRQAA